MKEWHKKDCANRMYCVLEDGKKVSMPRYYKDKIYESWERKLAASTQLNKLRLEEQKRIHEGGPWYERDRAEAVKAAFRKMELNYLKNQKL